MRSGDGAECQRPCPSITKFKNTCISTERDIYPYKNAERSSPDSDVICYVINITWASAFPIGTNFVQVSPEHTGET